MLTFESVSKSFVRGRREFVVLRDESLEISEGDHVGLRGGRGAGKSTFLRLCAGIELPDSGVIRFDGHDLATLSEKDRARHLRESVGLVSSVAHGAGLAARSERVVEYVATPLTADDRDPRQAEEQAAEALRQVGAHDFIDAHVRELSPGEYTLAGLARALIRSPKLILIDDPESCATPDERDAIRRAVRELRTEASVAVVLASASVGALAGANQLFALDGHGRLLAESREGIVVPFERVQPRSETA